MKKSYRLLSLIVTFFFIYTACVTSKKSIGINKFHVTFVSYFKQDTVSCIINNTAIFTKKVLNTNFSSGLTYSFIDYEDGLLTYRGKSGEKKFNLSIGDGFNLTLIINGVKKKYNISLDNGRYIVIDNYHDELKNLRQFKKRPIFD